MPFEKNRPNTGKRIRCILVSCQAANADAGRTAAMPRFMTPPDQELHIAIDLFDGERPELAQQ